MEEYFFLKQFSIRQDRSALKVGTDGMLLGGLAILYFKERGFNQRAPFILDVGTGTGIIALMLAQAFPSASLSGIEIDPQTTLDTKVNFESSPFSQRIRLICADYLLSPEIENRQWDLIISNPPFYTATHTAKTEERTRAKHAGVLPPEDFFARSEKLLLEDGSLALILPLNQLLAYEKPARRHGLHIKHLRYIQTNTGKAPKRVFVVFEKKVHSSISIETLLLGGKEHHVLLKDYLLEKKKGV